MGYVIVLTYSISLLSYILILWNFDQLKYTEVIKQSSTLSNSSLFELNKQKYITCNILKAGGLGNQIFRFVSLYGIGKDINRQPYFEPHVFEDYNINATFKQVNLTEIAELFPTLYNEIEIRKPSKFLTKEIEFASDCCKFEDPKRLTEVQNKYLKVSGDYLQSYKFFNSYSNEIKQLLECGLKIKAAVKAYANAMFKEDSKSLKLCVHIRRGDFLKDILLESTEDFVIPAINYVHKNISSYQNGKNNISIIFIGNDEEFVQKIIKNSRLKNAYQLNSTKSRSEDLCFGIEYCDSIILTASGSTFGWWISYLMKGNGPVFYNSQTSDYGNFSKDIHSYDLFPKEWISLTAKNGKLLLKRTKNY